MKFDEVVTIDWYDNILKSFCFDDSNAVYYCCILALNAQTDEKIYFCVDIKYIAGQSELIDIIKSDSFKENWNRMPKLVRLKKVNQAYLIKARNLRTDQVDLVRYKDNVKLSKKILWGEYPDVLEDTGEIDNWWLTFEGLNL